MHLMGYYRFHWFRESVGGLLPRYNFPLFCFALLRLAFLHVHVADFLADIAGKRISKNAGIDGFGNARDVRNFVATVAKRNYHRR